MALNLFHTEAVLQGDVLPHRTQSTVPPDQVKDHPNTVCEGQVTSTGKSWYLPQLRLPETVEDMSTFQPWADCLVIAVSPNQPPHHPYCHRSPNGCPIRQGYTSMPSVSRELSLFCPIHGGIPKGETPLWVSPFTHGTPLPAILSAQSPL